ncbi:fungal-specific transcription factor domain-containing protein [Dactylonectria macrodidyma]|uniref:Fungal-specific transcription factor domain-containing protein n=1 Tax=Dactylonectria macrodidyma TaxID=307937 RepID=A0A9P9DN28_9HYPO|nr:fungal-specific transcription factor domain-containing protein [Dactylonectria macrodidyma]
MDPPQRTAADARVQGPRPKRLKIDVACENCRAKKIKCDGVRPTCGSCSRKLSLRDNCRYSGSSAVRAQTMEEPSNHGVRDENYSSPPVANAQYRPLLADMSNRSSLAYSTIPASQSPLEVRPRPYSVSNQSPAGTTPGSRNTDEIHSQHQVGASVRSATPSGIDSMTAVVDEEAGTREFFGISSAGSFTAQIKKAIDARLGKSTHSTRQVSASSQSVLGALRTGDPMASDVSYVLPPRRQADHLMELYWYYVDPLYPFLDRQRWTRAYNAIFAGTAIDFDERIFVATLNIVLALSTQLLESQTLEQREQSSNDYFRRAQDLLPMSPWDSGSLELVQCLLVTTQYLQSTYHPHQTWMLVGSAIRTAQSLGLHLPETSADRPDVGERELLRRIWYGCVLMDRMVSVTHGRPAMISGCLATAVPLPLSSPPGAGTEALSTRKDAGYTSFFVESVRLYEIIHKTMIAFYGVSGSRHKAKEPHSTDYDNSDSEDEALDKVVQLDRSLSKWENRLPNHLRWNMLDTTSDEISQRQAVILRMRFLHARILLLRPLLCRFCLAQSPTENTKVDDTLQARFVEQGALFCVSTAQSMITTLLQHQTLNNTVGLLPAWWYRVYYVYSAATVLIAATLRPEVFLATDIGRSWGQALSVLKAHEKFGQSARRCVAALHILSSKILQAVPSGAITSGMSSRRTVNEEVQPGGIYDATADPELPDLLQRLADEFAPPIEDLNQHDLAEFNFDVNDLSWLTDMQVAWELLNE